MRAFKQIQGDTHTLGPGQRRQATYKPACHIGLIPLLEGSIRKRLHSRTPHRHSELITCYFLNLFISYQPVTCCLNASSSCGCQSFLSAERNQISIVGIFSLSLSFSHWGRVGRGRNIRVCVPSTARWHRKVACSRGSPRVTGRQMEVRAHH